MTNKEKYRKAFGGIEPREDFFVDLGKRPTRKGKVPSGIVAAALTLVLLLGGVGSAYAADFGGLRSKVEYWLKGGTKVEATILVTDDQHYTIQLGTTRILICEIEGDVTDGRSDAEELLASARQSLSDPQMEKDENGRLIIWWKDVVDDITDDFVDGVCYHEMTCGDETIRVTIIEVPDEYHYYYSCSRDGSYVDPTTMHAWKLREP